MMNVHHIVPGIADQSSGPSRSVPALCSALLREDVRVALHILEPKPDRLFEFDLHAYPAWRLLRRLGVSPSMRDALVGVAMSADIMHIHSLWMMPNIYPGKATQGTNCRLVISPRGTLSPWALRLSRFRKRIVWACGQRKTVEHVDCFHATAPSELEDIRRLGFTAPVAVIPNGVDIPSLDGEFSSNANARRRLLFLSRIHPKKGVDVLLRSWASIEKQFLDWELCIAGPDTNAYAQSMKSLDSELQLRRVSFLGAIDGEEKRRTFLSASAFVLPTHSENFGIAVAEALAHGVPAIVTKGAPWSGIETNNCGWWIDIGEESL